MKKRRRIVYYDTPSFFTLSLLNTKSLMAFISILSNKRKIFPKTDWNIVKGSGMVQGKLLFMKYYLQVWRFLKNNLPCTIPEPLKRQCSHSVKGKNYVVGDKRCKQLKFKSHGSSNIIRSKSLCRYIRQV